MSNYRFSTAEKYAIYKVLGPKCMWCYEPLSYAECAIDHVIPESLLGKRQELIDLLNKFGISSNFEINSFYNFGPIHTHCNQSKSHRVFEGTPIISSLLHSIKQHVPEIQIQHDKFEKKLKAGLTIAQIESALEKELLTAHDIEQILNKNASTLVSQNINSISTCGIPLIFHQKKGSYGEKSPKQLFDIFYYLFDSQDESLIEMNTRVKANVLDQIMSARDHYYNFLKDQDLEELDEFDSTSDYYMNEVFLKDNFLSFTYTVRNYSTGAIHEQYGIMGENYYLNPLRSFDLFNLLNNHNQFIDKIRPLAYDRMIAELKERDPEIEVDDCVPIDKEWLANEDFKPFTKYFFTSDSLTFIFNPYEISGWAYGAHFPSFKFSELINLFPDQTQFITFIKRLAQ